MRSPPFKSVRSQSYADQIGENDSCYRASLVKQDPTFPNALSLTKGRPSASSPDIARCTKASSVAPLNCTKISNPHTSVQNTPRDSTKLENHRQCRAGAHHIRSNGRSHEESDARMKEVLQFFCALEGSPRAKTQRDGRKTQEFLMSMLF